METETKRTRGPGRPKSQTYTITVPQGGPASVDEEKQAAPSPEELARQLPLFAGTENTAGVKDVCTIVVHRTGPLTEGHLGSVDPSADVEEIRKKWGGGEFMLYAKNALGQTVISRKALISGEPQFQSNALQAEYDRQIRNIRGVPAPVALPPAPLPPAAAAPGPAPAQVVPPPWGPPPAQPGAFQGPPPGYPWPYPAPAPAPQSDLMQVLMPVLLKLIVDGPSRGNGTEALYLQLLEASQRRESEQTTKLLEILTRDAAVKQSASDPLAMFEKGVKFVKSLRGETSGEEDEEGGVGKIVEHAVEGIKAIGPMFDSFKGAVAAEKAPAQQPIAVVPMAPATLTPALREQVMDELGKRDDILLLEGEVGTLGNRFFERFREQNIPLAEALRRLFTRLGAITRAEAEEFGLVDPVVKAAAPEVAPAAPPANGNAFTPTMPPPPPEAQA